MHPQPSASQTYSGIWERREYQGLALCRRPCLGHRCDFHNGVIGETYNIGGINEWTNIDLIRALCDVVDQQLGRAQGTSQQLITFVKDRAGHDLVCHRLIQDSRELGWKPSLQFEEGLTRTVAWYLKNSEWLENVSSEHTKNTTKAVSPKITLYSGSS